MDDELQRWLNPPPVVELVPDPNAPIYKLLRMAREGTLPPGVAVTTGDSRLVEWLEDPEFCDPVHL